MLRKLPRAGSASSIVILPCFHRAFRFEALQVTRDRRHGQSAFTLAIGHRTVMRSQRAFNRYSIVLLRMPDVIDHDLVVLAPKEWDGGEFLAEAEDISRRNLTLALCYDPVFDADPIAGVRIGPSRDVAGRKYARRARFEVFIDCNAAIEPQASLLGERNRWSYTHTEHDEVGLEGHPIVQSDLIAVNTLDGMC